MAKKKSKASGSMGISRSMGIPESMGIPNNPSSSNVAGYTDSTDSASVDKMGIGATPKDPHALKSTVDWWFKWLKASKKSAKNHFIDSREAWREFEKANIENPNSQNSQQVESNVYPVYNFATQIIQAGLYARTPELTTEREFDINDDIASTMCLIVERLGKYFIRTSNFDDVFQCVVGDFVHAAKTTTQVLYETDFIEQEVPVFLSGGDEKGQPIFVSQDGSVYDGEVEQDATGYTGKQTIADPKTQVVKLGVVNFDEILHTPTAKTQDAIKEMAYYFSFTRAEAQGKFDPDVLQNFPWRKGLGRKDNVDDDSLANKDSTVENPEEYIDGWECYCFDTKKVYWVSESYRQGFLKPPVPDPYGLKGFFPSPKFIIQNRPRKSLYPRPPYIHLRPTTSQLHVMYQRVFELIDSVRRRAIVDGDDDVVSALNAGDQEFVTAKSLKNIVEKGGLDKMIWYVPVQELVQAISELNALEDRFTTNVEKWFGTPDILQGVTDPIEAMGTQQIKAKAGTDRFKVPKKAVQQLARDSIQMMIDLAFKVFGDPKIADIAGFKYMTPEHQQRFPMALQTLRDDNESLIRIDIETDSLTFVDDGLKLQQRNNAIQATVDGIEEVSKMIQENPAMGALALRTVLLTLDGISEGKKFADEVKQIGDELIKIAQQPKPPPPDYEAQKLQIMQEQNQIAQQQVDVAKQQANTAQFIAETDRAREDRAEQVKEAQQAANNELKQQELELKNEIATANAAIQGELAKIAGDKVQTQAQQIATAQNLKDVQDRFTRFSENQLLELEKFKTTFEAAHTIAQETRLEREQKIEQHTNAIHAVNDHIGKFTEHVQSLNEHISLVHKKNEESVAIRKPVTSPSRRVHNIIKTPTGYTVESVEMPGAGEGTVSDNVKIPTGGTGLLGAGV